jgi:hypothetical protein
MTHFSGLDGAAAKSTYGTLTLNKLSISIPKVENVGVPVG